MIPPDALLAWAHAVSIWTLTNYLVLDSSFEESENRNQPKVWSRSLMFRLAATPVFALLLGWLIGWQIAVLSVFCAIPLAVLRAQRAGWRMAEREIFFLGAFATGSLVLIVAFVLHLQNSLFVMNLPAKRLAAGALITALFVLTIHGGTYVVRGVLKTSGVPRQALETATGTGAPSAVELKRGRLIGALERAVLFVVLVAGSYEALGFIVAAKGLIRSRDFEGNRDLTEYFLIGSLASVAVAVATGTTARYLLQTYW